MSSNAVAGRILPYARAADARLAAVRSPLPPPHDEPSEVCIDPLQSNDPTVTTERACECRVVARPRRDAAKRELARLAAARGAGSRDGSDREAAFTG